MIRFVVASMLGLLLFVGRATGDSVEERGASAAPPLRPAMVRVEITESDIERYFVRAGYAGLGYNPGPGTGQTHFVSFVAQPEAGECRDSAILEAFGLIPLDARFPTEELLKRASCDELVKSAEVRAGREILISMLLWNGAKQSRRVGRSIFNFNSCSSSNRRCSPADVAGFVNSTVNTSGTSTAEYFDEASSACAGQCFPSMLLTLMLSKANYFDRLEKPRTAAAWRFFGLRSLAETPDEWVTGTTYASVLLEEQRAWVREHIRQLYVHAETTRQLGLAQATAAISSLVDPDSSQTDQIGKHLASWEETEAASQAPLGREFRLADGSPVTDDSGYAQVFLSKPEFRFSGDTGQIESVYLQCKTESEGQTAILAGQIDANGSWSLDPSWAECFITVLGETGAAIKLWEFQAGSIDAVGNIST